MPSFALEYVVCYARLVYLAPGISSYEYNCDSWELTLGTTGPLYYDGGYWDWTGSGSSNSSTTLPVNGSSTPNPAVHCNSPNAVKNNEVKRLYTRARNDFFNNEPNSTFRLNWLNQNQMFDVNWGNEFGSYILSDSTLDNGNMNNVSNVIDVISEESCF